MIDESALRVDDITPWAPPHSCAGLRMLRLDRLHPIVSGNKWFKLKHNVAAAQAAGKNTLLTFGGGYSNHLVATAFAAQEHGLQSIGLVRGHYTGAHFTPTLQACMDYGMQLVPRTKAEYAAAAAAGASPDNLAEAYPNAYIIPEGGANEAGWRGAAEIAHHIPDETTDVCLAIGTGTTLKGLLSALPKHVRLHGFYVAKDIERTTALTQAAHAGPGPQLLIHHVADPRFGKWTDEARQFITRFHAATKIPLDGVYTSKMMMQVEELLKAGFFAPSSQILCIHTGGLQGMGNEGRPHEADRSARRKMALTPSAPATPPGH